MQASTKLKLRKSILYWLALLPMCLLILFPFAVAFTTVLKPLNEITKTPPTWFPEKIRLDSFFEIWDKSNASQVILNSVFICFIAVSVTSLLSIPAAYALCRFKFRGKGIYKFFLLITQMFSPIVLILGLFRLMIFFDLLDSLLALGLVYAAFNMAFAIWMFQSYFETIPPDLEEAAQLEGATALRSLVTIFLPLALPALVVVTMFVFVNSWNEFIIALSTLRSSEFFTVQLKIVELIGYYTVRWDYVMAFVIISSLPVIVVFIILQRFLIRGLSMGAVK